MEAVSFGHLSAPDPRGRREVHLVPMRSPVLTVSVLTFGASLHTVEAPDRTGRPDPVHLSMPTTADYEDRARNAYLGATCGRYANRIAGGRFSLDGRPVNLQTNDGTHTLHGGPDGFARRVWDLVEAVPTDGGGRVVLALHSPDGDQGFPGALDATATYELHGHTLRITYEATATAPTVVSLTSHGYWNLAGPSRWTIDRGVADHELRVPSDQVLVADHTLIPTGPPAHVEGSRYDLRHPTLLDDVFEASSSGIDNSYVVHNQPDHLSDPHGLHPAAELHHPASGRTLTVETDQPVLHVYTANRLGPPFGRQAAICLEAQQPPDGPNRAELGSVVLRPGDHYRSTTELTFGVR